MKKQAKRIISNTLFKLTSFGWVWSIYKPFAEVNAEIYLKKSQARKMDEEIEFFKNYKYLISDTVKDGPFKGLKYPFLMSLYSTLFPKLLGCYEFELHDCLHNVFHKKYHSIVDIGCAEGYYAVGFAKRFQDTIIYAADINPEAREKTKLMATANGVTNMDLFRILDEVTPDFLLSLDSKQRHFIFSDCEGYEASLFSDAVITHLMHSDFLVEIHDFVYPGISDLLRKRFEQTHTIQMYKSVDDVFRYREIQNPEILEIPLADQIKILAEKRPSQMEWLFCEATK